MQLFHNLKGNMAMSAVAASWELLTKSQNRIAVTSCHDYALVHQLPASGFSLVDKLSNILLVPKMFGKPLYRNLHPAFLLHFEKQIVETWIQFQTITKISVCQRMLCMMIDDEFSICSFVRLCFNSAQYMQETAKDLNWDFCKLSRKDGEQNFWEDQQLLSVISGDSSGNWWMWSMHDVGVSCSNVRMWLIGCGRRDFVVSFFGSELILQMDLQSFYCAH